MQHDHVPKMLNFDLMAPLHDQGVGLRAKVFLLPCFCICDSIHVDMQHDHVLKKLNFDLLILRIGGGGGG